MRGIQSSLPIDRSWYYGSGFSTRVEVPNRGWVSHSESAQPDEISRIPRLGGLSKTPGIVTMSHSPFSLYCRALVAYRGCLSEVRGGVHPLENRLPGNPRHFSGLPQRASLSEFRQDHSTAPIEVHGGEITSNSPGSPSRAAGRGERDNQPPFPRPTVRANGSFNGLHRESNFLAKTMLFPTSDFGFKNRSEYSSSVLNSPWPGGEKP
jgi:hypothetical protein